MRTRTFIAGAVLVAVVSTASLATAADALIFKKVDYFEVVTKDDGEPDEKKRVYPGFPTLKL